MLEEIKPTAVTINLTSENATKVYEHYQSINLATSVVENTVEPVSKQESELEVRNYIKLCAW